MGRRAEAGAWFAVLATVVALYAAGARAGAGHAFGVSALAGLPGPAGWVLLVTAVVVGLVSGGLVPPPVRQGGWLQPPVTAVLLGVAAAPVLWAIRSNFINPDGLGYADKFLADVPRFGAHVTHDEMLELYVHSRFWDHARAWWGWSVEQSYQVLSCAAGVAFVFVMARLAPRLAPRAPWLLLGGALAGGYLQLFFGDVENYTITAALVAGYLLAAARYLDGDSPLWLPAVTLATAITFHLVAGWLLPSALYLAAVSRRRHGSHAEGLTSGAVGLGVGAAVLVYLHFNGLPFDRILSSHAARALRVGTYSYFGAAHDGSSTWAYYRDQANLLMLLCPAVFMLGPLAAWRRLASDEHARFLLVAAASLLVFQGVWTAQLGVYNDWNLYAVGALVIGTTVWRAVALAALTRGTRAAAVALAVVAALHTGAWIVSNHFHAR